MIMDYIYIGKIVNTHGIKGEVRILSDFQYKNLVFKKNFEIYIGNEKIKEVINSYRPHKMFDMITLKGIDNINDVLKYKGLNVYIDKSSLSGVLFDEDYIGLDAYTDHLIGKVVDIRKGKVYDILVIEKDHKQYLVPNIDEFIEKVDTLNNKIIIHNIKGLIDED